MLWGLVTSYLNDTLGVRKSLLVGYSMLVVTLIVMSMTTSLALLLSCLFIFLPLSNSMGIPMLTIGIRRYTTPDNRGFAYGIFYSCMNIGAALSGPLVDFFNIGYKEGVTFGDRTISGNRMVIFSCSICIAIALITTFFCVRDIR
jgi:sugar phosphate permease